MKDLNLQNSVYEATNGQYIISERATSYFSDVDGELIKKHLMMIGVFKILKPIQ